MKTRQVFLFCFTALTLFTKGSFGQQAKTLAWNTLQFPVRFSAKWELQNDISYRMMGVSGSAYQYTFRTGIRRIINGNWTVASGLAFFFTRTSFDKMDHEFGREFRLWQEGIKEFKLKKKLSLFNRFRMEERFFAATSKRDKDFALRFRYRLAAIQTISKKWKVQLADEYMQQLAGGKFRFQQNRLGAAAIYVINNTAQLQAGYIWSRLAGATQHFITCTFLKTIIADGSGRKG